MEELQEVTILDILERMTEGNVDNRCIATSELLNELVNGSSIYEIGLQGTLLEAVLEQLFDEAPGVSKLALTCLSPMLQRIHIEEHNVAAMARTLTYEVVEKREQHQHRDVACAALKKILCEVEGVTAVYILSIIRVKLVETITATAPVTVINTEIKCACLDVLCAGLIKCEDMITGQNLLLEDLLGQLHVNHSGVRNKTISCIAALARSLSDDLLKKATREVVRLLGNKGKPEITRTNIQMLGALCRSVGERFGTYLPITIPLLMKYITSESENEEVRECILQAMESFLLKCSADVSSFCEEILHISLKFLSYDPYVSDNMEEDTDYEIYEEEEQKDDEDVSWKVRGAAAKCLAAFIISRPEMLPKLFVEAYPKLIDRFGEREEVVKMDVFNTFIELVRQTGNATNGHNKTHDPSPKWLLKQEVPKIVKSVNMQLQRISVKTKVSAFSVLKELAVVLPDCVADNFRVLIPQIEKALCDKSSTSDLKLEALNLTRLVLASNSPIVFQPYIEDISRPTLLAVRDSFYKVTAEALRVCGEIVCVVRPHTEGYNFDYKPFVHPIYSAIMECLTNQDQYQEVKECAISCIGLFVSTFGDNLGPELPACLTILANRMGNEITRLAAVKAFAVIAASPMHLDLSCVLEDVTAELTTFLRKDNQALKEATLQTLNALERYGDKRGSAAPQLKITSGRPRKRISNKNELVKTRHSYATRSRTRGTTVKCSCCGELEHNRTSCKAKKIDEEKIAKGILLEGQSKERQNEDNGNPSRS